MSCAGYYVNRCIRGVPTLKEMLYSNTDRVLKTKGMNQKRVNLVDM